MKIVHMVYSLDMGGAEVVVGQLCRAQRAQGHQVAVFSYAKLGVVGEGLVQDGFDVYVPGPAHPVATMRKYLRRLRMLKPDVVHCHNVAPTLQGVIPARLAGVPCIVTTLHSASVVRTSSLLPPAEAALQRAALQKQELKYNLMGRLCTWVTGICETTCDSIRQGPYANSSRVRRVYNGTAPVERTSFDHLGKQGFTLLFVGRIAPEKDLDTLIRATVIARAKVPGLTLWVVGGGRELDRLQQLATELNAGGFIRFWGQRTDTAPFFSAADAFVMSSLTEGLPMSLLQSMSLGVPAILTDVGGCGEVLRLTGAGLLATAGDSATFAQAIVRLATDPTLHAGLGQKALTAYEADFTLDKMAGGYMALYRG